MRATLFLSRATVIPTEHEGMVLWREQLFATMARNARTAPDYYNIPMNCVIETRHEDRDLAWLIFRKCSGLKLAFSEQGSIRERGHLTLKQANRDLNVRSGSLQTAGIVPRDRQLKVSVLFEPRALALLKSGRPSFQSTPATGNTPQFVLI